MSIREMQSASPLDASDRLSGKSERGSALLSAVLFLIISTAAAVGVVALVGSASETSHSLLDSERAFYAAESAEMMSGSLPRNGGGENKDYRVDLDEDSSNLFGALIGNEDGDDERFGVQYASAGCESGKESLYVGWAGGGKDGWGKASARHAICATPNLYASGNIPNTKTPHYIEEDLPPSHLVDKINKMNNVYVDDNPKVGNGVSFPAGHTDAINSEVFLVFSGDTVDFSGETDIPFSACFEADISINDASKLNFDSSNKGNISYVNGDIKNCKGNSGKCDVFAALPAKLKQLPADGYDNCSDVYRDKVGGSWEYAE